MAAETLPVLTGVVRGQRRSLFGWALALTGISVMYIGFYPVIGQESMADMVDLMPADMAEAIGYDQMSTAAGYVQAAIYGLLGMILLLVFAIGAGARMLAGEEEAGTLELEYTSPVTRAQVYVERLGALWLDALLLVGVLTVVCYGLGALFDLGIGLRFVLAGSAALYVLIIGMGTIAYAVGAVTGRRAIALGAGAGVAAIAFVLDYIGPLADLDWMTAVSPMSWYLGNDPLINGFDVAGLVKLAVIPVLFAVAGFVPFTRRDLMA